MDEQINSVALQPTSKPKFPIWLIPLIALALLVLVLVIGYYFAILTGAENLLQKESYKANSVSELKSSIGFYAKWKSGLKLDTLDYLTLAEKIPNTYNYEYIFEPLRGLGGGWGTDQSMKVNFDFYSTVNSETELKSLFDQTLEQESYTKNNKSGSYCFGDYVILIDTEGYDYPAANAYLRIGSRRSSYFLCS